MERLCQMTYLRYPLQSYDYEALGRTYKPGLTVMLSCSSSYCVAGQLSGTGYKFLLCSSQKGADKYRGQ